MNDPINPKLHAHLLTWNPRLRDLLEMILNGINETNGVSLMCHIASQLDAERAELIEAIGEAEKKEKKEKQQLTLGI
jgi:hypothetical protein